MSLRAWEKIGKPEIISEQYGKRMFLQRYQNPKTGACEDYFLFGENDYIMVLPVTQDYEIIAVRQYKQGCDGIITELPAGGIEEADATPKDAAMRELLEETGYSTERDFISLGNMWAGARSNATRGHLFLAMNCIRTAEPALDESEEIETVLFSLGEWIEMIQNNSIESPDSIAATFRALPHLGVSIQFGEIKT